MATEETRKFGEELSRQLDDESRQILESELGELARIARLTESIAGKLAQLYQYKFPKSCGTCGRVYQTREEYLDQTRALKGRSTTVQAAGVQEYRNCACGSTLMVWTGDRRDNSEFGQARRALFDVCLAKLRSLSEESDEVLRQRLREVFRAVSSRLGKPVAYEDPEGDA